MSNSKDMAPQKKKEFTKKTASPKKIAAKKTILKKTPKKMSSKMISPKKKTVPKNAASKMPAAKKSALKKKIAIKRAVKDVKSMGKKDARAISKSSEERAARAARRSLTKDAATADNQPERKKARLDDAAPDLVNLLATSAGVLDILAASGSRPTTKEVHKDIFLDFQVDEHSKVTMKDGAAYELDHLLGASPGSSSVLDIMSASGSRPMTKEARISF